MVYGKKALCREQQAPPIALVWCNSPSKECLRPSLSIWPSSLPEHLGNVSKEEEVSIRNPKNFLIQEEEWFMPPRQHWKKWSDMIPPCSQSKQGCMSYTLSQLLWVLLTGSTDMETREDPRNHWNLPVDVGTLSSRVSMMYSGVHMRKTKTTCVFTHLWQK